MLDPYDDFYSTPKMIPKVRTNLTTSSFDSLQKDAYKEAVVKSLLECSGLHYAPGDSHRTKHGVLTLVSICKSIDLTNEEFDMICNQVAAPNSELSNRHVRQAAWNSWSGNRVKAATRDEWISTYGGSAIKMNKG